MRKNALDEQLQSIGLFVCILHAVIGDVSLLCFLSVLRINNLRVFNTCRGSTPAASTTFIFNKLLKKMRPIIYVKYCQNKLWDVGSFCLDTALKWQVISLVIAVKEIMPFVSN